MKSILSKPQRYSNLAVLDVKIADLTDREIQSIVRADWFETPKSRNRGIVLIDVNQLDSDLEFLLEDSLPIDWGIKDEEEIVKINDCLKRWNEKDGFYHA